MTLRSPANCPATSMPVVEYSVDQGPFTVVPLTKTGELYVLPLADQLDPASPHRLEVYFRAADLCQKRWTSSMAHLRVAGLELAADGTLLECPRQPKRALCFGDSITEGVGVDGLFTSWQSLSVNNARGSWCPIVCAALGCEYGQLGSGGQGIVNEKMALPPLPRSWDRYDAETSRLTGGRLKDAFVAGRPTQLAFDGVHPSMYGNAVLSALIVAQVERVLSLEEQGR